MMSVMIPITMSTPKPSKLWRRKPTKGLGAKEPNMLTVGCDYYPSFQQIAFVDTDLGQFHKFGSHAGSPEIPMGESKSPM